MSVSLQILEKPILKKTKMNCDGVIDKSLLEYPMIEDCFSKTNFTIFIGKMGQGKSSLMTSFVKNIWCNCYHKIILIMPENSRESIEDDLFGKCLHPNQLFTDLTSDILSSIYDDCKESSSDKKTTLLIIDDFQAQLKDKDIVKMFQKIITKNRHLRTTIVLLNQNYQALPKMLRELASNLVMFNLGKSQMQKIFDESIQYPKEIFQELIKQTYQNPHDYMVVNLRNKHIYKGFDKFNINED